jgi:hypothetical protein
VKSVHSEESDKGEYYHWHNECPDYPQRGRVTILIFQKKPTHLQPCHKCAQLDSKKT